MLGICKSLRHQAQTPFVRDAQISRNADEPSGHVLVGRRRHCPRSSNVPESSNAGNTRCEGGAAPGFSRSRHVDKALVIYDETWNNPLNGTLPLVYRNRT